MPAATPKASKSKATGQRFPFYFAAGLSILMAVLYLPSLVGLPLDGFFTSIEDYWQDKLYVFNTDRIATGDPRILIAAIDDASIQKLGWPFTRDKHAQLIEKLTRLGAKTISFDVMFLDPDKRNPAGDRQLIAATRRSGRVVHQFIFAKEERKNSTAAFSSTVMRMPIHGLVEASRSVGYPNLENELDPDGHIRRQELFSEHGEYPKNDRLSPPSFAMATAAVFLDRPLGDLAGQFVRPWIYFQRFRRLREWVVNQHQVAAAGAASGIHQVANYVYRHVSVADILEDRLTSDERKAIQGAIVLVGSTTLGLYDHYPSPFMDALPGVEFNANTVDNIIHDDFTRFVPHWKILLILLAFIWLPVAAGGLQPAVSAAMVAAVLLGWFIFTDLKFLHNVRYEFMAPTFGLVVSYLVLTVYRALTEGAEKRFIKQTFGQFVAPEVVDDLVKDPSKVQLGGEKRDMTVFFLDIAHFTTISEKMKPEALILFLNKYLSALSHIIHQEKGVVDKYIGDCIMAFWNAPLELKDHRAKACLAAVQCQEVMAELNKDLDPTLPETPAIRIGVNSGDMTVGLTGSEKKLQYTVIGDEVNLASRLEGANKFFGSKIMASESCYSGGKDAVEARELGRVRVVGKDIPIRVYELLAEKGKLSPAWQKALPMYNQGLSLFQNGVELAVKKDSQASAQSFAKAKEIFAQILKDIPKDGPSKFYMNASEDYSQIPPDNWDGVFNLTAK